MKISIYAETSLVEQIALGHDLAYISPYYFQFVVDTGEREAPCPRDKIFCGEVELKLPSRDAAVMIAQRAIQAEAAAQALYYETRLSKLLAITWEGSK